MNHNLTVKLKVTILIEYEKLLAKDMATEVSIQNFQLFAECNLLF